ncbi:unnamed protein product [Lactuca virosa]|uniref:Uncharacterized protein n=1 Tax=Lactuca virosa TaxID=75947 RepID=A0AAU9ME34_9ASTR|nr:unnamed protein product [Lactuca virosa]
MPLVQVLRLVDGEQTPAMRFIYGAMDECKEKIAKSLDNNLASYKEIWDIIDKKWELQMHRDFHAAAYYLSPQYRWSPNVSEHPEIKRGLYDVMERLVKDTTVYLKIEDQLVAYKEKRGLFGYRAAPSDGEEDEIGGGGILGEEDGGVIGSARGGRAIRRPRGGETIGEGSGTRKRKNVQVNLIDEDDGDEVNLIDDDEGDQFENDANDADYFI